MIFENRYLAGDHLSILLKNKIQDFWDTILVGILKGGAPLTQKIAENLQSKATFLPVKGIFYKNYKIWVITQDGSTIFNKALIWKLGLSPEQVKELQKISFKEVLAEKERYNLHINNFEWKHLIVIDDGVVSGLTAAVVWKYLKEHWASKLILATPIANSKILEVLRKFFNEIILADAIEDRNFWLSKFYMSYYSLSNEDIYEIIHKLKDKDLWLAN